VRNDGIKEANKILTSTRKSKAIATVLGRLSVKTDKWNRSALNFQRHVEPSIGLSTADGTGPCRNKFLSLEEGC